MSKMIQIRHVPDALHRRLTVRAAAAGMSLSDYLKDELKRLTARPTLADVSGRLRTLEPVAADLSSVEILREVRGR
jgi:antitoxin FitA